MAENSKIEWTDHTFNPWMGCTRISPGCDHCYAEAISKRTGSPELWQGQRRRTSESYWRQPLKWQAEARKSGTRRKVFCASMGDVFDNQVDPAWREDLWTVILLTPNLDWQLLTKRPQNIRKMLPASWDQGWPNVWLGTSAENQEEANRRIPHLLAVPAALHFLSCEPLLGFIDLADAWHGETAIGAECWGECNWCKGGLPPLHNCQLGRQSDRQIDRGISGIGWVIAGGESGGHARPMHPEWIRSLRDQCKFPEVPFFFKHWGEWGLSDPARRVEPHALADDGTLYRMADLVYPDGARYAEACRAKHERAHLHSLYRVGKKAAGATLDGREHRDFPNV